jgi:hypothetical protein
MALAAVARVALCTSLLLNPSHAACLDPFNSLCIDASPPDAAGVVTLNATCFPSPGSVSLTWCGFGFSRSATSTMFPATLVVAQIAPNGTIFLEDRDAAQGYALPPCFAEQVSTLVDASRDAASGVLRATWTRAARATPAQRAAGYADLAGAMTALAASSSDGAPVAAACLDYMTPHVFVQPGVPFSFPA